LFLLLPLACVFINAFSKGLAVYFEAISNPAAVSAIKLTLLTAFVAVPLNMVFGVAASWAIAKFDFFGKTEHTSRTNAGNYSKTQNNF
jgi:sulfate transport system permease protein